MKRTIWTLITIGIVSTFISACSSFPNVAGQQQGCVSPSTGQGCMNAAAYGGGR
ncbi:hypothetical protein [Telmatospirillum sp.]|uniref:hypothetical protein n=1 Tax=Telmatospirillum sp. TaxID=2079197 RepID=UPI00283B4AC5|nr:hypothetical protein [Telmatospirillum sp.]MDR3439429.1 hypothetical protein [Telmatospirillum sp.]